MDYISWVRYGRFVGAKEQRYIQKRKDVFDQQLHNKVRRVAEKAAKNAVFALCMTIFWTLALSYIFNAFSAENVLIAGASSVIMSNTTKHWGILESILD